MSEALYNIDVLRLAASVADFAPLADPEGREERRSPTCGSRMTVTLSLGDDGKVSAIGLDAKACALGQAAAAILARHAIGKSVEDLAASSEAWRAWLTRESDVMPDWPELDLLARGRDYPARHPSMRLAFEAAAEAAQRALAHHG